MGRLPVVLVRALAALSEVRREPVCDRVKSGWAASFLTRHWRAQEKRRRHLEDLVIQAHGDWRGLQAELRDVSGRTWPRPLLWMIVKQFVSVWMCVPLLDRTTLAHTHTHTHTPNTVQDPGRLLRGRRRRYVGAAVHRHSIHPAGARGQDLRGPAARIAPPTPPQGMPRLRRAGRPPHGALCGDIVMRFDLLKAGMA